MAVGLHQDTVAWAEVLFGGKGAKTTDEPEGRLRSPQVMMFGRPQRPFTAYRPFS